LRRLRPERGLELEYREWGGLRLGCHCDVFERRRRRHFGACRRPRRTGRGCTASTGPANTIHLPGLRSSLNCVISGAAPSGSADATVAVFDNHTDAAAFATMLTSSDVSGMLLGGTHERAVLGSNWVVLVPDDASYADAVHTALGGTVLTGGSSTAGSGPSSTG
jgi:hypothetical protein